MSPIASNSFLSTIIGGGFLSAIAADDHLFIFADRSFLYTVAGSGPLFAIVCRDFLFIIASNSCLSFIAGIASLFNASLPLSQPSILSYILHCSLTSLPALLVYFAILYTKKRVFDKTFITLKTFASIQ